MIASTKKIKALDSNVSVSSTEPTEVIRMKMELVQQAKKVETLECKLEEMGKQLRSYEIMRIRIDLLELEVMLLTEKSKTNEMFTVPHLKDEDISTYQKGQR
ncbi:BnaCnng24030D [Brassica napus]|uniref:BnaCnng24030D protein n=2 Tax=Brassica TaxID=3705 RepID=A0A078ITD0_BRANA|nr:BnaCnng24030D [Brassica napus]